MVSLTASSSGTFHKQPVQAVQSPQGSLQPRTHTQHPPTEGQLSTMVILRCQEKLVCVHCEYNPHPFEHLEQAAQEFTGYRTPSWLQILYVLVALMTGGLLWLLADYLPGRPVWAMRRCHLKDAEHVLVQVELLHPLSVPALPESSCPNVSPDPATNCCDAIAVADGKQKVQAGKSQGVL